MSTASEARDIDGKEIAKTIRDEIKNDIQAFAEAHNGLVPGLAVILVGSRRDSQTYVNMKKKACLECGIDNTFGETLDESMAQELLLHKIKELNANDKVHGILVQLPLPAHLDQTEILDAIDPCKDVDGLHPLNVAQLTSTGTHQRLHGKETHLDWTKLETIPFHIPCTPQGCMELLDRSNVSIRGKNAVVIGRSNLVGLPVALLLIHRDATVTIVHSKTQDIESVVRRADIVIAAVGRAEIVTKEWLKPDCVVIDVGINSVPDDSKKRGYRLVGDVNYQEAKQVASQITPVPGGVGPMTIAMLLRNTLNACRRSQES